MPDPIAPLKEQLLHLHQNASTLCQGLPDNETTKLLLAHHEAISVLLIALHSHRDSHR